MEPLRDHSPLNISETVRDRGLVSKDHQQEMAYGEIKQLRHVTPKDKS